MMWPAAPALGEAVELKARHRRAFFVDGAMPGLIPIIEACRSTDEVSQAAAAIPAFQRRLMAAGLAGRQQGMLITAVVDALTSRLIELAEAELGPSPGPWAWLACGSQGRREQSLHTDQDNAIVHADGLPAGTDAWFRSVAESVTGGLATCGIAHCPGGVGPDHSDWRRSVSDWTAAITGVVRTPDTRAVMLASHYFDFRTVHGPGSLLDAAREPARSEACGNGLFLARFKQNALRGRVGVGILRRWRSPWLGTRRGTIHLKQQGLLPVAQLALAYALEAGTRETGTADRLRAAAEAGLLTSAQAYDLRLAHDTVATLRNEQLLRCLDDGRRVTNRVRLADLTRLQRSHLRAALGIIRNARHRLARDVQ